ncbi:hypothetical protein EPUL_000365 [Erysiphe pulchra]|uniref:Uncharacterized protein n=1 Tax=Erysiphe pulchra TaxID=225359 RepID=A0A2S4Q201_9PEZI|nr:hypothetical protein EPUL_000365 [Erysiphe pulchra]
MKFRDDLLSAAGGQFMSSASPRPVSNWFPILVSTDLKSIMTTDSQFVASKSMLTNKIEQISSKRPALVKLYGPINLEATWLALFSETPRTELRVLNESGIIKIFLKKLSIDVCKR